ncbi:MAG: DUF4856 domain-containing protein [Bacteroidota bacterium]
MSCESSQLGAGTPEPVEVPEQYDFPSRILPDTSSVYYPEPIVQNLLIEDLGLLLDEITTERAPDQPVATQALLAYYEHRDSYQMDIQSRGSQFTPKSQHYSDIASGVDLASKISDDPIIGFDQFEDQTADQLVRAWMDSIEVFTSNPDRRNTPRAVTTTSQLHLGEMIPTLLLGSVVYHQATGKYLSLVHDQNNTISSANNTYPYTDMEHYWDQAFGYFGAARDYHSYSDSALARLDGFPYRDSNADEVIDMTREYNFRFAKIAGQRNASVHEQETDFTQQLFDAFLKGRTDITNTTFNGNIERNARNLAQTWDALVAASVIHYINQTKFALLAEPIDQNNLNKQWANLRAFVIMLQYNPLKRITNNELRELVSLIGDRPPSQEQFTSYQDKLETARYKLKQIYEFTALEINSW